MKRLITLNVLLLMVLSISAQDRHFTQFYAAPMHLNPALTGAYSGKYRVFGVYRDQWRGVLDQPYQTFTAGADVRWEVELDSRFKDAVGAGIYFFNDKVNDFDFSTNMMAVNLAFHKGLDYDKRQFLSLGIQGALAQRNINYEDLVFDDQFNDIDAFDRGTREILPENNFSFGDLSVGLNYTYLLNNRTTFFAGLGYFHILEPTVSFYPENVQVDGSKLYSKINGQFSVQFPINDRFELIPRALFSIQGPHQEFNAGTNLRIALNDYNSYAIQIGSWVRPVKDEIDGTRLDAVIAMIGFELENVVLGFSYDINLESVQSGGPTQNAFEISATYNGNFENEDIMCPRF